MTTKSIKLHIPGPQGFKPAPDKIILFAKEKYSMAKDYFGKCGSCKHCDLNSGYTFAYSTSFICTRSVAKYRVKADEKPCSKYEADHSRSNSYITSYYK